MPKTPFAKNFRELPQKMNSEKLLEFFTCIIYSSDAVHMLRFSLNNKKIAEIWHIYLSKGVVKSFIEQMCFSHMNSSNWNVNSFHFQYKKTKNLSTSPTDTSYKKQIYNFRKFNEMQFASRTNSLHRNCVCEWELH